MKGERNPQGTVLPQPFLSLTPIRGQTDIGTAAPIIVVNLATEPRAARDTITPAMEAGISTRVWTVEEIVGLLP